MFLAYLVMACTENILYFAAFLWIFSKHTAYFFRLWTACIIQGTGKSANSIMVAFVLFYLFPLIVPNILLIFLTTDNIYLVFQGTIFYNPKMLLLGGSGYFRTYNFICEIRIVFLPCASFYIHLHCISFVTSLPFQSYPVFPQFLTVSFQSYYPD